MLIVLDKEVSKPGITMNGDVVIVNSATSTTTRDDIRKMLATRGIPECIVATVKSLLNW